MKKILCMILLLQTFLLVACVKTTTTTAIVETDPFEGWTFVKPVVVSEATLRLLAKTTTRLVYLDDEMVVTYEFDRFPPIVDVYYQNTKKSFQTGGRTNEPFIFQYDSVNEVLYYTDSAPYDANKTIWTTPSTVDETIHWHLDRSVAFDTIRRSYQVIGNQILTFRGEVLFKTEDTLVFPSQSGVGDPGFFTYLAKPVYMEGCTVFIHHGFGDEPVKVVVDDDSSCDEKYREGNKALILTLRRGIQRTGFAFVSLDGTLRKFLFAEHLTNYESLVSESLHYYNNAFEFTYRDTDFDQYRVSINMDLTDFVVQEADSNLVKLTRYWDETYRFAKGSDGVNRIYKNGEVFHVVVPRSNPNIIGFRRFGDVGIIVETPSEEDGQGRLTRIDLITGEAIPYDLDNLKYTAVQGDWIMLGIGSEVRRYSVIEDRFEDTPMTGSVFWFSDSILFTTYEETFGIYESPSGRYVETHLVAKIEFFGRPFAYLIEYQGRHYLIG